MITNESCSLDDVRGAIKRNELHKAGNLLALVVQTMTDNRQIQFLSAQLLEKKSDLQKARDNYLDLCNLYSRWLAPAISLFLVCMKTADTDLAEKAMALAEERGATKQWLTLAKAKLTASHGRITELAPLIEELLNQHIDEKTVAHVLQLADKSSERADVPILYMRKLNTLVEKCLKVYPDSPTIQNLRPLSTSLRLIRVALSKNDLETAESLLSEVCIGAVDDRRLRLLTAIAREKAGDFQKAKKLSARLCEKHKDWLAPAQRLFEISLKTGDTSAAGEALTMAGMRGASRSWLLKSKTIYAALSGNVADYLPLLDKLIRNEPSSPYVLKSLYFIDKSSDTIRDKYECIDQLSKLIKYHIKNHPQSDILRNSQQLLWQWSHNYAESLPLLGSTYQANKNNPNVCVQYLDLLLKCSHLEKAKQVFINTMKSGICSVKLLNFGQYFKYTQQETEYLSQCALAYVQSKHDNISITSTAQFLTTIGHWRKASELLKLYKDDLDNQAVHLTSKALNALIKFLETCPETIEVPPPIFTDAREDCSIHRVTGAKATLIIFPGLADAVTFPLALFHSLLKPLKINIIYLRDSNRSLFTSGLASLSDDLDATFEFLRNHINQLEGTRLYCIGTSAGGFAACTYGKALQAKKCFSFSGPTNLTLEFVRSIEMKGFGLVNKINSKCSRDELDLKKIFGSSTAHPKIIHYFCEDNSRDRKFAEYISDLPSVELRPLAGDIHASFLTLLGNDNIVDFFKEELSL